MRDRQKEKEADARDRQKEKEELEEIKRKLFEEGHPDPETEIAKVGLEIFLSYDTHIPLVACVLFELIS